MAVTQAREWLASPHDSLTSHTDEEDAFLGVHGADDQKAVGTVLFCMDCSGIGKTSTIIDAALDSGALYVFADISFFRKFRDVAVRCREFYLGRDTLRRYEVIRGFQTLFEAELVPVLTWLSERYRGDIENACGSCGSCGESSTGCVSRSASDNTPGPLKDAWVEFLRGLGSRNALIHFYGIHELLAEDKRPTDEDLICGVDEDQIGVEMAPRFALRAFLCALDPLIRSESRIRWAFSGLPPSLTPTLNAPPGMRVVDLAQSITYFEAEDVYKVFLKHINPDQPPLPRSFEQASERMKFCMRQLAGPPIMIQYFFASLYKLEIRSVDQLYLQWGSIQRNIVKSLSESLRSSAYATAGDVRRCLVLPFRERLWSDPQSRVVPSKSSNYWTKWVREGLVRLSRGEPPKEANSHNFSQPTQQAFSLPYLFLQKMLCARLSLPPIVIHALTDLVVGLEVSPSMHIKRMTLEALFVAFLLKSRPRNRTAPVSDSLTSSIHSWTSRLHIYNCSELSMDRMVSVLECLSDGSCQSAPSGTESTQGTSQWTEFEASLDLDRPESKQGLDSAEPKKGSHMASNGCDAAGEFWRCVPQVERVRVMVGLTLLGECGTWPEGELKSSSCEIELKSSSSGIGVSNLDFFDSVSRMVASALELFDQSRFRTVIVAGGPHMPELSEQTKEQFLRELTDLMSGTRLPTVASGGIPWNRPLTGKKFGIGGKLNPVPRFAIFYLSKSDPIWKDMTLPVSGVQHTDTDEIRRFILQRFISEVGSGVSFNENDRGLGAHMARERAKKRKANYLDDICQSLRECRIVCEEQIRIFQQKMSVRSVPSLEAFTKELIVAEGLDDICAELISEHILRFFDPRLPLRFGNDHDNDQP